MDKRIGHFFASQDSTQVLFFDTLCPIGKFVYMLNLLLFNFNVRFNLTLLLVNS